jgi:hypothetical protein
MKLGLITDIHEHVEFLRIALDCFEQEQVDQVVVLGDVVEMGERLVETCRLLIEAKAIGVWGNHDHGFCVEPSPEIQEQFPTSVFHFMATLRPRLEIDGCYFAHVEPWLDPEDIADLWFYEGPPENDERIGRIFNAVPNRLMFAGHYHKWLMVTPMHNQFSLDHLPARMTILDWNFPPLNGSILLSRYHHHRGSNIQCRNYFQCYG